MRTSLLAALCVAVPLATAPLSVAQAEDAITVTDGGPAASNTITIANMGFSPNELKIKVGDSITWTNNDDIAHNVHFRQGPAKGAANAQGKMMQKGETHTVKFNTAGEYKFVCTPHPPMKGTITVE